MRNKLLRHPATYDSEVKNELGKKIYMHYINITVSLQ